MSADDNPQPARNSKKKSGRDPTAHFFGRIATTKQAYPIVRPTRPKNNTSTVAVSEPAFSRASSPLPSALQPPPPIFPSPSNPVQE